MLKSISKEVLIANKVQELEARLEALEKKIAEKKQGRPKKEDAE